MASDWVCEYCLDSSRERFLKYAELFLNMFKTYNIFKDYQSEPKPIFLKEVQQVSKILKGSILLDDGVVQNFYEEYFTGDALVYFGYIYNGEPFPRRSYIDICITIKQRGRKHKLISQLEKILDVEAKISQRRT